MENVVLSPATVGAFGGAYRGRRVLLTGHTGFKGPWMALWLRGLGAGVAGYALAPDTEPNLFTLASVAEVIEDVRGDVRDFPRLLGAFEAFRPEVAFHLAAQPLVRRSYREPRETFETNVMGTVHFLEAVRQTPSVRAAVVVTSDKCYENREWVWGYRENDPVGGHDPYSASKGAAEVVAAGYRRSFFAGAGAAGVATARAGNVIGGGDWAEDRIIPDAVRAAAKGEPLVVRNPGAVRPWQHVLEPLGGYLALGARLLEDPTRYGGAWNFGPDHRDVCAVRELASAFYSALGKGEWSAKETAAAGEHEANMLWLSCDKARMRLAWTPVWGLDEAVERTADWYRKASVEGGAPRSLCESEIAAYLERAKSRGSWWAE